FMGIRDTIPIEDDKKGFYIDLDTCAYFREEAKLRAQQKLRKIEGKISKEKPQKKQMSKSHSENLFEALANQKVKKSIGKRSYHVERETLLDTPLEEDINLPLDSTCMVDMSKIPVEEIVDVNIGIEEDPNIFKLGNSLSAQEHKTFTLLLRKFVDIFA
ncbi:hypothetical protein KI387_022259, partial [Taxus chinensis]